MNFIRSIVEIPVFIAVIVLAVVNDDFAKFTLKPFNVNVTISLSVLILGLFFVGYFIGRLDGYVANAPLRSRLRQNRRANKALNKEHEKLNKEHEKLNADYSSLREDFTHLKVQNAVEEKAKFKAAIARFFKFNKG